MGSRFIRCACALVLALALTAAGAETGFAPMPPAEHVRDVAVAPDGQSAHLALYNHNEVWRVDLAEGEVSARVSVPRGPLALALSPDGGAIAVLSGLGQSLTVLDAVTLAPRFRAPVGKGAQALAALPGGGFAVANTFDDTLTLVSPSGETRVLGAAAFGAVPHQLAASNEGFLLVATRSPAAVTALRISNFEPAAAMPLDRPATALAALPGGGFAVAANGSLFTFDPMTGASGPAAPISARALAAVEDELLALTNGRVVRLDGGLRELNSLPLAGEHRAIAAGGGVIAVSANGEAGWRAAGADWDPPTVFSNLPELDKAEAPSRNGGNTRQLHTAKRQDESSAPSPSNPASHPGDILSEPCPAPECGGATPRNGANAVLLANAGAPRGLPRLSPREPAAPAEPRRLDPGERDPREPPEWPVEPDDDEIPLDRRRPSPYDTLGPRPPTIGDVLRGEPAAVGPWREGFRMPDLTQPIDTLDAARLDVRLDPIEFDAEGDVRFEIDDTVFNADALYYNELAGELRAQRNVSFLQERFELWADHLQYFLPEPPDGPEVERPIGAPEPLRRGRVALDGAHIYEPGRELHAERLTYDFDDETGEAEDVRGRADVFYFGAETLRVLGPADAEGEDLWVTTCNHDPPHYRIRLSEATLKDGEYVEGERGRLEVLGFSPPVIWPRWRHRYGDAAHLNIDFDSGRGADIGYYVNVGQRYPVTPNIDLGYRFFPTEKEGVGFGVEGAYDYMTTPASPLYRSEGDFRSLYTTEDRWYYDVTHRQEVWKDTVLLLHSEQWSDRDFYKDFFFEEFPDRSEPRTYANITHTHPDFIATGTVRRAPHGFIAETQRMPEGTFHLLERRLNEIAYLTYDVIVGYNERRPARDDAFRLVNVARVTGDFDVHDALKLTPYLELEGAYYSKEFRGDRDAARFSALTGVTAQSRLQRAYTGALGFSQFRHIVQPSITYSYRPRPTMSVDRTPRFDFYDNVYGRSRFESKIDNVVLGQDAETGQTWQVGRLSLFHGDDLWNELRRSTDYEAELDIRPRPWWGMLAAAEYHTISDEFNLDEPFILQRSLLELYETVFDEPFDREQAFRFNAQYGSYRRWMSYLYYDDRALGGNFHARAGLAYTRTQSRVFNREILYGLGHTVGDNWTFDFEHRYDFERNTLARQEYSLRRKLHCWEIGLNFRERQRGWDVRLQVNLVDFPGTRVTF